MSTKKAAAQDEDEAIEAAPEPEAPAEAEEAAASDETEAVNDAPTPAPKGGYKPKVINPEEEAAKAAAEAAAVEADQQEAPPTLPPGDHSIVYRGMAHQVEYGEFTFRPGTPVTVPSEVALELLTHPRERFEIDEPAAE